MTTIHSFVLLCSILLYDSPTILLRWVLVISSLRLLQIILLVMFLNQLLGAFTCAFWGVVYTQEYNCQTIGYAGIRLQ